MVGSAEDNINNNGADAAMTNNDAYKTASPLSLSSVCCSICLDLVADSGDRSRAKLQCGHEFHLDCIGSAFNMKGAMQCPNCRKVERGRWLFGSSSASSLPDYGLDDYPMEDPYDLSFAEMPFGVHWCPFSGLTGVHSSFEELESPSTTFHDLQAHSYVAYLRPIPHAATNSSEIIEDPNFSYRWSSPSGHNEIYTRAFPAINSQYQSWGRHSHPPSENRSHVNSADQASGPPATLRSTRVESDGITRSGSFVHQFPHGHGSIPRSGSSFFTSMAHPFGSSRSRERNLVSQVSHHQQQPSNPTGIPSSIVPGFRRFSGPRGLPLVVPAVSQSDRSGGFYIFPPSGSSGLNPHETENLLLGHVHPWERDHLSRFPVVSVDRESGWGSSHHPTTGGSDSSNRSGSSWQRHW